MTIAVIAGVCVLLLVLAFIAPRLSRHPQRGVTKAYNTGGNVAGRAPGPLGRLLRKPFDSGSKWSNKSASAGRRGRRRLPL
jgi:hypothetical protein